MKLLDRYVATGILQHFGYALVALLAIFTVINLTEELRLADEPAYRVAQAARFVLMTLPAQAYELFPAAAVLGTVMGLGQLARQHEIVAVHAAGVSPARLALTILITGVGLAFVGLGLGEVIAAPLAQQARSQRALALSGGRALSTSSGLWLRDGSRFIHIGVVHSDSALEEVSVFDFDEGRDLRRFTQAQAATRQADRWTLENLLLTTLADGGATTQRLAAQPWDAPIEARRLRILWLQPSDLSIAELARTIAALQHQRESPLPYVLAFWRRVSAPVYTTLMVMLAFPVALAGRPRTRIGERILLGALIGLGFQLAYQMVINLGMVTGFPPLPTVLAPAVAMAAVVVFLLRGLSTR